MAAVLFTALSVGIVLLIVLGTYDKLGLLAVAHEFLQGNADPGYATADGDEFASLQAPRRVMDRLGGCRCGRSVGWTSKRCSGRGSLKLSFTKN